MNKIIPYVVTLVFLSSVYNCFSQNPTHRTCDGDYQLITMSQQPDCDLNYILVFEDNFDGVSVDQSKWWPRTGPVRGWDENNYSFTNDACQQWYQPENVYTQNGRLILSATNNGFWGTWVVDYGPPVIEHTDWFDYRSGEIDSRRKFHYGFYEIVCKMPGDRGFFPAFWNFGSPPWSEIDGFEINTTQNDYLMSVHYDFTGDGNSERCTESIDWSYFNETHKYAFEWTPFRVSFLIDDDLKWVYYRYWTVNNQTVDCEHITAPANLKRKDLFPIEISEIIANLAVFRNEDKPDETTTFPSNYEIEYIKYYQDVKDIDPKVYVSTAEIGIDDELFNVVAGQTVTFSSNIEIGSSDQLEIIGEESIDLLPGVEIHEGSVVNLRLAQLGSDKDVAKDNDVTDKLLSKKIENLDLDFNIYPNPSNGGKVFLTFNKLIETNINVTIFNSLGTTLYDNIYKNTSLIKFEYLNLKKGIYVVKVTIPEINFHRNEKIIVM